MFITKSFVWFRCLLHYWGCAFTGTPPGYPAVVLWCGDPAALSMQDLVFNVLQQTIDGVDTGVVQPITLPLCLESCRIGKPDSSPSSWPQGELPGYVLVSSSLVVISKGQGQFCFHFLGWDLTHFSLQGLLYCVAQGWYRGHYQNCWRR